MISYDVILADPPWSYSAGGPRKNQSPESHYSVMSLDDIKRLRVPANDNAALFMWCVDWVKPSEWIAIGEAWGFEYKTRAWVWVKANPSGFGFRTGMGYYTRSNPEDCNLFVRGKMPVVAHDVLSVIYAPIREHSRKPDEQYEKIERLYPNMRYLELFARRKREGWDAWGNEVESDVELPCLEKLVAA